MDTVSTMIGTNAVLSLVSHIFFVGVAFFALQSLMYEKIFKKGKTFQIQLLLILVSVALGTAVSNFFLQFVNWSQQLQYLL